MGLSVLGHFRLIRHTDWPHEVIELDRLLYEDHGHIETGALAAVARVDLDVLGVGEGNQVLVLDRLETPIADNSVGPGNKFLLVGMLWGLNLVEKIRTGT